MTKKYLLQGFGFLFLTVLYIFIIFRFGIPLAVKVADLVQKDKGTSVETNSIIIPPRLNYVLSATNSAELVVSGYATANQAVDIYLNEKKEVETPVDAEGFFSQEIILTLGSNKVYALARDPKGETSGMSNEISVNYLDIAPELIITEPIDGQEIKQKDNYTFVKGSTEAGLTLKINGHLGVIGNDGNFSYRLGLSEGENTIVVEVTDTAGNTKKEELKVNFKKR